jgi:hypothetical protein
MRDLFVFLKTPLGKLVLGFSLVVLAVVCIPHIGGGFKSLSENVVRTVDEKIKDMETAKDMPMINVTTVKLELDRFSRSVWALETGTATFRTIFNEELLGNAPSPREAYVVYPLPLPEDFVFKGLREEVAAICLRRDGSTHCYRGAIKKG